MTGKIRPPIEHLVQKTIRYSGEPEPVEPAHHGEQSTLAYIWPVCGAICGDHLRRLGAMPA